MYFGGSWTPHGLRNGPKITEMRVPRRAHEPTFGDVLLSLAPLIAPAALRNGLRGSLCLQKRSETVLGLQLWCSWALFWTLAGLFFVVLGPIFDNFLFAFPSFRCCFFVRSSLVRSSVGLFFYVWFCYVWAT